MFGGYEVIERDLRLSSPIGAWQHDNQSLFSGLGVRGFASRFFEIVGGLVCFNHVARYIVHANHSMM
jgi:hypothetical protein